MTDGRIAIAPMTVEDLPDVLAIERASFATPWTEANLRHEIRANPFAWNLVLRLDDRIAAFACAYVVADELMINDLAVHVDERRRGLARAVLQHLLSGARARGCRRATLEVRPSNGPARALYERFGFALIGRRPGYYSDTGEDALVLEATLASP